MVVIANDQEFQQAVEQMERMYRALAALRAKKAISVQQFEVLAEGPIDEIRRLQREMDAYLGVAVAGST